MDNTSNRISPLFIGHGSPMNAIASNSYTHFLASYAQSIPSPKAVVVISAHWQSRGTFITGSDAPEQIYDFYGFPDDLYRVRYAPPGTKTIAQQVASFVSGISVDSDRGIDHAAWAVLMHMYPKATIPVLELSLDIHKSPQEHFLLGQRLQALCNDGILFIGSGNMVHNLRDISFEDDEPPFPWAVAADAWLKEKLELDAIQELIDYERSFPNYKRSIPTNEHYLPLLYILGMRDTTKKLKTLYEAIQNGSISMRSIAG